MKEQNFFFDSKNYTNKKFIDDVENTIFYECNLSNADFRNINISKVRFVNCQLKGAKFKGATLYAVFFESPVDTKVIDLDGTTIRGVKGYECELINMPAFRYLSVSTLLSNNNIEHTVKIVTDSSLSPYCRHIALKIAKKFYDNVEQLSNELDQLGYTFKKVEFCDGTVERWISPKTAIHADFVVID